MDTAPFYGVRLTGYMLCTLDGIRINESMNALDEHGDPIEGPYVCGNDSGAFFAYTYPDQITGLAAGRSATFARRAGRIAATGAWTSAHFWLSRGLRLRRDSEVLVEATLL